ncbi:hypothetical protein [Chryseobacterium oranimense]|nr:hypothetical protein [Chryseobacterium oranimense]
MKKMQTADNASFVSFLPYKAIALQWLYNLLGVAILNPFDFI